MSIFKKRKNFDPVLKEEAYEAGCQEGNQGHNKYRKYGYSEVQEAYEMGWEDGRGDREEGKIAPQRPTLVERGVV